MSAKPRVPSSSNSVVSETKRKFKLSIKPIIDLQHDRSSILESLGIQVIVGDFSPFFFPFRHAL